MRRTLLRWSWRLCLVISVVLLGSAIFLWARPAGEFRPLQRQTVNAAPSIELRLLSWNILKPHEEAPLGEPWEKRKPSYAAVLATRKFDLLCLQEAYSNQIEYFSSILPGYSHYGVGLEDGKSEGEHCPIFYDASRFELRDSGTFWLSPTPEKPSKGWGEGCPRICSWVELMDRQNHETFRVYNIHLQLNPFAQPPAADLISERLSSVTVPIILTGDFNAPHRWPAMKRLYRRGLSEVDTGEALTFHVHGKPIRCLDHILIDNHWFVQEGGILNMNHESVYPSDHFGIWATLQKLEM